MNLKKKLLLSIGSVGITLSAFGIIHSGNELTTHVAGNNLPTEFSVKRDMAGNNLPTEFSVKRDVAGNNLPTEFS
ncbi:hypothetical protein QK289_12580, partial [Exiguobacterium antarcticum]